MQIIPRLVVLACLFSLRCGFAQPLVIPQVADGQDATGGRWRSTVVLTNTTTLTAHATLTFSKDIDNVGHTGPWSPTWLEGSFNGTLSPADSVFLHTPGTGPLAQGWAEILPSGPGVEAYVIYTFSVNGRDQDSTAPAVSTASRILVPFDNTNGLTTALAVVNPNAFPLIITANFKLSGPVGTVVRGAPLNLPAEGQLAFVMPTQFPGTATFSGLAEFSSTSSNFSIIALRGNPTGGLTSLQMYYESGPPVIATSLFGRGITLAGLTKWTGPGRFFTSPRR
jgi:hypothetical protein